MKPVVIIPVYNHGSRIVDVVRRTSRLDLPILVIDDGSTDSTAANIEKLYGITCLRHPVNLGKGAAIITGLAAAREQNYDYAVTLDGDGQHDPEDVEVLLRAIDNDERVIVIGCRQGMKEGQNVPWTSRFGRKFSNFWVWAAGGPLVDDSQSGFRLYPVRETVQLEVKAQRYQFEVEVLVRARQQGIEIREVPVRVIYQPKGVRVSHFRPWLDFYRNSATFSRLIFSRFFRIFRP
ncbi:MAG: glycosyltransferase family 2 protein [Deltaproteobacteria bacterium]|nr:glycosyltransferase family 2 protein [Deltaproteobacteria bacterium]